MTTKRRTTKGGYIALMSTIFISLTLLVMAVREGASGFHLRFNVLGIEDREQANALAEGCLAQAITSLMTDPSYTLESTTTFALGTCYVFLPQYNFPTTGEVTILTQSNVRGSYVNLSSVMSMDDIHSGHKVSW